jgi:hypothetical protein
MDDLRTTVDCFGGLRPSPLPVLPAPPDLHARSNLQDGLFPFVVGIQSRLKDLGEDSVEAVWTRIHWLLGLPRWATTMT